MIKIVLVLTKKGDGLLTGSTVFGFKMSDGRCLAADLHRDAADTSCFEVPSELLRRLMVALLLGVGVLLLWTTAEGVSLPLDTTLLRSPCSNAEAIFLFDKSPPNQGLGRVKSLCIIMQRKEQRTGEGEQNGGEFGVCRYYSKTCVCLVDLHPTRQNTIKRLFSAKMLKFDGVFAPPSQR